MQQSGRLLVVSNLRMILCRLYEKKMHVSCDVIEKNKYKELEQLAIVSSLSLLLLSHRGQQCKNMQKA